MAHFPGGKPSQKNYNLLSYNAKSYLLYKKRIAAGEDCLLRYYKPEDVAQAEAYLRAVFIDEILADL